MPQTIRTRPALAPRADGAFDVTTSAGQAFIARAVFIAGGVGAFQPRQLQAPGAEQLAPTDLLYRLLDPRVR